MRSFDRFCRTALAALGAGFALGAFAATSTAPRTATATTRTASSTVPSVAGLGRGVDSSVLAKLSGGTEVNQRITITGSVSDTSTENVSTGANWIGGGSFGNAAGLPIVIQNSGNSVLIQNATVVNVQMQP